MNVTQDELAEQLPNQQKGEHHMNEISEEKRIDDSSPAPCYVAITTQSSQVGPDSWDVYPITKTLTRDTTVGEIADWFALYFPNAKSMQSVKISQAT